MATAKTNRVVIFFTEQVIEHLFSKRGLTPIVRVEWEGEESDPFLARKIDRTALQYAQFCMDIDSGRVYKSRCRPGSEAELAVIHLLMNVYKHFPISSECKLWRKPDGNAT